MIVVFAIIVFLIVFLMFFFRKPRFSIKYQEGKIYSPAFGKVIDIEGNKVKVFLSLFDVHWQYAPCVSKVSNIVYIPGKFKVASKIDAEEYNERNIIELENGVKITQIAGVIARRIRCFVKKYELLKENQVIGLIAFGSQVVIEVPNNYRLIVKKNHRVYGLNSIIAEL
ncbi:MAG: phosphatidylserine decarboxylase [bacterium]|nr:phosphatidylserine decarboxylase [bacterium]